MSPVDCPVMLANPTPCHGMWSNSVFDMGGSTPQGCASEYRAPSTGNGAIHKSARQSLRLAVKSASDIRVKGEVQSAYWKPLFSPKKPVKKDDSAATKLKTPSRTNNRTQDADGKGMAGKRKRNSSLESILSQSCLNVNEGKNIKKEKEHDKYCHFCQHVKVNMLACESPDCTHRFCTYCLAVHLGDNTDPSSSAVAPCRNAVSPIATAKRSDTGNEDPKNKACKSQKLSTSGKTKKTNIGSETGSAVPLGPPEGSETRAPGNNPHEHEDQKAMMQAQADRVLGLLCMITAEQANVCLYIPLQVDRDLIYQEETEESLHSDCSNESDSPSQDCDEEKEVAETTAESCTSSLEELALFALQSLAAIPGEDLKAAPVGPETTGRTGDVSPGRPTAECSPCTPREDLSYDSASPEHHV
ncbi:hypothetical protein GUITHDRAFT_162363 [Guillardia theta CCMP2712]|uniref:RING-type domain-containing protein n=1 Tax=Guillardia theta (strain CCMP2712) TaxID=905079 RepID=L1JIX4_GUITC|nr:hypothetical protein GUITHDRAFT_162363 [Guillardia theta CCMP2712]EKX48441.1 hypothetical protein GUITHDRAFT_162363 [Guillardia theta CCMP2712]|eukprot:XP_005835421.1 hypothetical protein GUITHDRAFT_162363 [Guillardia theta CCMP2712]